MLLQILRYKERLFFKGFLSNGGHLITSIIFLFIILKDILLRIDLYRIEGCVQDRPDQIGPILVSLNIRNPLNAFYFYHRSSYKV